ncbi:MAG: VOC family protein [Bacteroidota bacterium]
MKTLVPSIVFPGTCKQALSYYVQVFGGKVTSFQTFGQASKNIDPTYQDRIFDATFLAENMCFKASDDLPSHPTYAGSNMSLFVAFTDPEERKTIFQALADQGEILFPLDDNYGMLKDAFGIQWIFVLNRG